MAQGKEYYVFISYKSEDVEWAIWLQHELEHYHLPASFNGRTDIRQELRPVFRDIDELSAGNLPKQIRQALKNSQNLIVVCSPQAATSPWVNQEIKTFISLGRTNRIFPFIVDGDSPKEFFPPALLALPKNEERLGGDAFRQGRDIAFVKVVAGILGLGFDSLWNRYEKEKAEQERKEREQRDNLLRVQSRFIAEKAIAITNSGNSFLARRLLLEVLPLDLEHPNRPYTKEAEASLRYTCQYSSTILREGEGGVNYAIVSPDGKFIISAHHDCTIRVWEVSSGRLIHELKGHTEPVTSVSVSPDCKYIVSAAGFFKSKDYTIRVWKFSTGELINTIDNRGWSVYHAAFSPNGNQIISASENCTVSIWEGIRSLFPRVMHAHTWPVNMAVFNPDCKQIISAAADNTIRIWDVITGKVLHTLMEHMGNVNSVSYRSDGKYFVSASDDKTVRVWDSQTGDLLHTLEGHTDKVKSAVFSPNGRFVVSASADNTIRIWDIATGLSIKTLTGHSEIVNSVCFSYDGKTFVTASDDSCIRVWDASFLRFDSIDIFNQMPQRTLSYPDHTRIIEANGNRMSIYSAGYEHLFYSFEAHYEDIRSISLSSDVKRIVSSSTDFTIKIWNAYDAKLLQSINIPVKEVLNAVFSPDGRRIFVAVEDNQILIIDITTNRIIYSLHDTSVEDDVSQFIENCPLQKIIAETRERFKDNPLTPEERKQYYLE